MSLYDKPHVIDVEARRNLRREYDIPASLDVVMIEHAEGINRGLAKLRQERVAQLMN